MWHHKKVGKKGVHDIQIVKSRIPREQATLAMRKGMLPTFTS